MWLLPCRRHYRKLLEPTEQWRRLTASWTTNRYDSTIFTCSRAGQMTKGTSTAVESSGNGSDHNCGRPITAENAVLITTANPTIAAIITSAELYEHYEHTTPLSTTGTTTSGPVDLINPLPDGCSHYLYMLHLPQARLPQPALIDGIFPPFHEWIQETCKSSASTTQLHTTIEFRTAVSSGNHIRRGDSYYRGRRSKDYRFTGQH